MYLEFSSLTIPDAANLQVDHVNCKTVISWRYLFPSSCGIFFRIQKTSEVGIMKTTGILLVYIPWKWSNVICSCFCTPNRHVLYTKEWCKVKISRIFTDVYILHPAVVALWRQSTNGKEGVVNVNCHCGAYDMTGAANNFDKRQTDISHSFHLMHVIRSVL